MSLSAVSPSFVSAAVTSNIADSRAQVAGIKVQTEVSIAVDAGDVELDEKARQTVIAFKPDPKRNSLGEHEIGFSDSKSDLDVARATWRT
jgi:hypothetical protein